MSELYLIRHAQASFGTDNYDQLSALGEKQSRWLGEYYAERGIVFDQFITGDMRRHQQTMDAIVAGMGVTENRRHIHPGLNEYDFQHLVARFGASFPEDELYLAVRQNPADKTGYYRLLRRVLSAWSCGQLSDCSETWQDFSNRVEAASGLIRSLAEPGNRVLAVSSGGAISAFIGHVLALSAEKVFDLNLQTRNTGVSHFFFNREKLNLSGFNAVPHLETNGRSQHITYG